jgi:Domain of unknown function (DUF4129)
MTFVGLDSRWRHTAAPLAASVALLALSIAYPHSARSQELPSNAGWRDLTLPEYQQHLANLDSIVAACQTQRSHAANAQSSFPACDSAQIGPDDRVHLPPGALMQSREVRYDWLRSVLAQAARKDDAKKKTIFDAVASSKNKPVSVNDLLAAAHQRLQDDLKQAQSQAEAGPDYSTERKSLNTILSQRAYQGVAQQSATGRFREWVLNLLDKLFSGLVRFGSKAPWIVWLLRILLLVGIGTALIWFFLRIERRSSVRLIPDIEPASGAPSAREWQLWLRDAQAMAAKGRWREAIHFLYWASISRLESKRLWPADRARTPREYLALLAGTDPRKSSLATLTRSFERTWYGGRAAQASDFNAALEQAAALGVAAE